MLVQNNNPVNPLTSPAEELKTVLPAADQKTQKVSKGFFASLGKFAVKLLKTVVILATFPVSLPLMYLVSKIKNASTKASSLGEELNAKQKLNELTAVASPAQQASSEEEMLIPKGFFDEQPAQEPASQATKQPSSLNTKALFKGAALGLAGAGLAATAYWYGSGSSTNAPLADLKATLDDATCLANLTAPLDNGTCLANLTAPLENAARPLASATAVGFPLENPLKGLQEKSFFETPLHLLMTSRQNALPWAIQNFNRTAN